MAVVTVVRPTATGTMAVVWVSMVRGGIQNMGMTRSVMTVTIEEAAEDRMPLGSTGWMKSVRNVQAPLCCLGRAVTDVTRTQQTRRHFAQPPHGGGLRTGGTTGV
mmetsp:Transcript_57936/g.117971  ORF Transcript_57936/g.117971 Transcript_57936/m.117971 type:complete len:105 (+) Transcript_57936:666-980(+)